MGLTGGEVGQGQTQKSHGGVFFRYEYGKKQQQKSKKGVCFLLKMKRNTEMIDFVAHIVFLECCGDVLMQFS